MKNRANWLLIPAVAVGLAACNKKQPEEVPAETPPAVTGQVPAPAVVPAPPAEPAVPKMGAEERAARLGFAGYLPQETEVMLAVYDGSGIASRFKDTKLWQMIQRESGLGGFGMGAPQVEPDMDVEMDEDVEMPEAEQESLEDGPAPDAPAGDDAMEMEPQGPAALFGKEFTIAMGDSTSDQLANLLTVNRRMTYFQMRNLARGFVTAARTGDTSAIAGAFENNSELVSDLFKDPKSGMDLLDRVKMPPLYFAFRSTAEAKDGAAMQLAAMVENVNMMAGGMAIPVEFKAGEHSFQGAKILGEKISESMAAGRADMEEDLGAETVDRLLASVAAKNLVIASGTVGDYVLLFIGGAEEDLKLAATPAESLAGTDALAFCDAYATKDLMAVSYSNEEANEKTVRAAGGFADITNGLRDGLTGAEGLGDTRDLDALFQMVAEREQALQKLAVFGSSGMVAFFEEGVKVEGFSGSDAGMFDWDAPNKLSHLGDAENVVLFADATGDAEYDEKSRAFVEALGETAYAVAMKVAQTPVEGEELSQFKEMAEVFDTRFRADVVAMWDALSGDLSAGLGHEGALVIDLQGGAPAVPGLPQTVVDEARVPRISMISPVVDRSKVAGSWDKMESTIKGALAKVSEMVGQDIPMQKPISSEKDGKVTWFYPMPFLTEDFLPSVTLSDNWFVASTSKNHALDLIAQASAGGETRNGFLMSLNFKALQTYAANTLEMVEKNSDELLGGPMPAEQKRLINDGIGVLDELDSLTIHTRKEGEVVRSSVHLKTR